MSASEPERVRITTDVLAAIDAHARAETPRECCGLLVGVLAGANADVDAAADDLTEIRRAAPARNLSPTTTRYDIDPADHFRIIREARAAGLTVLGAYHSHPASAPIPSPTDLAEGLPNFLYIIATLQSASGAASLESRIRAYYFHGQTFREIRLILSV